MRKELGTYKHAFETTSADRDRLIGELATARQQIDSLREDLETYKHAFETTGKDRDRLIGEVTTASRFPYLLKNSK